MNWTSRTYRGAQKEGERKKNNKRRAGGRGQKRKQQEKSGENESMESGHVKLEIYIPEEYVEELRNALADIGVGEVGQYSHVVSCQKTWGYWKPLEKSHPYSGKIGEICTGEEVKMEMPCKRELAVEAARVIRQIHPYEEPVFYVIPLLNSI